MSCLSADGLVHIVFGFSKDFCASGLRVGCLLSKNAALNKALDNISYFNRCACHNSLITCK
jgi:1-aminocyclopropane-1-carboxylate synthase